MIIPAIDLIEGKVVRLFQGDYAQKTDYSDNPLAIAESYAQQGASWLHIVDLTGAKYPEARQLPLLKELANSGLMKFQAGGGIRTEQDVEQLLETGMQRVVIGSVAVKQPQLVMDWFRQYGPEQIVLALDINIDCDGKRQLATHGWQENSGVELDGLLNDFLSVGAKHVLCTDISKDGTLAGANNDLYQDLSAQFNSIIWQASGGIGSLQDIQNVKDSGAQSVILGRALLEGKFTLSQAIELWGDSVSLPLPASPYKGEEQ